MAFQYRSRTIFAVMFLVAIVLAPVGMRVRRYHVEQSAVERIVREGGKVSWRRERGDLFPEVDFIDLFPAPDLEDSALMDLRYLSSAQAINIGSNRVTDSGLANLVHLKHLRSIYLVCPKITSNGLDCVKDMRELAILMVVSNQISKDDLKPLTEAKPFLTVECLTE